MKEKTRHCSDDLFFVFSPSDKVEPLSVDQVISQVFDDILLYAVTLCTCTIVNKQEKAHADNANIHPPPMQKTHIHIDL